MDIQSIKAQAESEINNISSQETLEEFRLKYLGRKGLLAQLTGIIPTLPKEERGQFGQQANALKTSITAAIEDKQKLFGQAGLKVQPSGSVDLGMPGIAQELGHLHPLTRVTEEICAIFTRMGFSVVEGPEIETEFNNFTGLNIPLEHPSRDAFDTFYIKAEKKNSGSQVTSPATKSLAGGHKSQENESNKLLLRSHTSPVQIRVMKTQKPPLAVVVPGRVYRPDAVDASHSFMFHQIEGFLVDEGIRFSDLKGVLEEFARGIFGNDIKMRFRPHFFPFTEPSVEVDVSCVICQRKQSTEQRVQKGVCPVCHGKGWLEVLGSGMIHPNVFKHVGIDAKKYSGFAFGMGVERIAMLKYGINDIRLFFENDLRFLQQF